MTGDRWYSGNEMNSPRQFDLTNPQEIRRLLLECEGYLRTCKRHHHGTDFEGRDFAMQALRELAERLPHASITPSEAN